MWLVRPPVEIFHSAVVGQVRAEPKFSVTHKPRWVGWVSWVSWVIWVIWVSWVEGLQNRSTRLVHAETGQQWSLSSMWAPSPAWKSQHDVGDTKSEWPSPEVHSV